MADYVLIFNSATGKLTATLADVAQLANAAVTSAKLASGAVGQHHIAWGAVTSGKIAANSITEDKLLSGISIDISEYSIEPTYMSKNPISGCSCIHLVSGKLIDTALPNSGYLPAIGLIGDAIASGILAQIYYTGRFSHGLLSSLVSGYWGKKVYLSTSGQISRTAPSASGQCVQAIGEIADNNSIFVFPEPTFLELAQ